MGTINLLDISVANLIAAGEVVDRPASVVKELLENSIDAGATEITVEIKHGGISLIRVSDNGCGMSREDAEKCVLRHATSKIRNADDLNAIATLGFRGEALAAISSVSKMRILTKRKSDSEGTLAQCDAGVIIYVGDTGCRDGTTMIVEDLFSNVPARLKFLKKDSSEAMAVSAVVEKIALSRPDISLRFISDNLQKLQTPGDGKLYSAIYALFGRDFAMKLMPVRAVTNGIEVTGFIGKPDNARVNRNFQNFFINARYVRSRTATAALEQAFSSYMETGKFPCCVLDIIIHPAFVDVNVHPTKLEVKFSNERVVFDAVYCAVRGSLEEGLSRRDMIVEPDSVGEEALRTYNAFVPVYDRMNESSRPEQTKLGESAPSDGMEFKPGTAPYDELRFDAVAETPETAKQDTNEVAAVPVAEAPDENITTDPAGSVIADEPIPGVPSREPSPASQETISASAPSAVVRNTPVEKPSYRILGMAFATYIVVETGNDLLMIDKHAAHERILFEEMKKNMHSGSDRYTQLLLIPVEAVLDNAEYAAAVEFSEDIRAAGFGFECDGDGKTVSLLEIPGSLTRSGASDMFCAIAGQLADGTGDVNVTRETVFERALYQASCKAAIKAGTREDEAHLRWICDKLISNPDIRYCPHGRPIIVEMSKNGIEHKFKRS